VIPNWVNLHLKYETREIENMNIFMDKYIFIGENRGNNIIALRQWVSAFTVKQDLPRLALPRIENRMISGATLYPDDEYGAFFETFIKAVIDADYSGARIEDSFWVKRRIQTTAAGTDPDENPVFEERYDFLILISVDKTVMQNQIRAAMDSIKVSRYYTREQIAAINRIKQNFFEGF